MSKPVSQFWEFKNSIDPAYANEATLYIYGDIVTYDLGSWNFPDDVVPYKFKDELNALEDVNTIHVRINSNGGSVFAAYAIMNLLKSHKAEIITYIDGIAASAATLIAMAGNKIVAAIGSVMMIHLPSTGVWGNANDLQKAIDVLNTITESMVDVYHSKTGIDKAVLRNLLNNDDWMTGAQALEKGFVDEVADLEVVAYLGEDKKTAFFNGVQISLENVRNKDVLMAMLPSHPQNKPRIETRNHKEAKDMTLGELKVNHPAIYDEALNLGLAQAQGASSEAITTARNEGYTKGVTAERERMKAIDNIALPGMEAITNKAKYETGITAEAYAMEVIASQKQKGITFLSNAQADAAELDDIPTAGEQQNGETEEKELLAYAAEVAQTIRRVV